MSTITVNTHEAKSRLSELIRRAEKGDDVIVARSGQPVARITAWSETRPERVFGSMQGQITIVDDDDVVGSDPDIVAAFAQSADSER